MVQGFVLLRLYQASLMVAGGIRPAEPYALMSVIRIMTDVVESPLRSADGSGCMLMIRMPNSKLGKHFRDVLMATRNRWEHFSFFFLFGLLSLFLCRTRALILSTKSNLPIAEHETRCHL